MDGYVTNTDVADALPRLSLDKPEALPLAPLRLFQSACGKAPATALEIKVPAPGVPGYSSAPKFSPMLRP